MMPEPTNPEIISNAQPVVEPVVKPVVKPTAVESHPEKRPAWTWLLIAGVIGLYALGLTTTALTSRLLKEEQYLQLIALSPRYRNFIAGSSKIDLAPFLLVGVARLLASDPLYYLVGRHFGDGALRWFERLMGGPDGGGRLISMTERWFHSKNGKVGIVLSMFFAGPIICILAGQTRMKAKKFFALDFVGTIVVVLLLRLLAKPLQPAVDWLIDVNKQYWKFFTAIAVGFVVLSLLRGGKDYVENAASLGKDE